MTQLIEWETIILEYERQAGENLSGRIKAAILVRHAPDAVKQAIRGSWHTSGGDYAQLRGIVVSYLASGKNFDQQCRPKTSDDMDVGAVWRGGKGDKGGNGNKGDGRQHYGFGGKGDKGCNKGDKGGKGVGGKAPGGKGDGQKGIKGGYDGKGKGPGTFPGNCSNCWKYGHKVADFWNRKGGKVEEEKVAPPPSVSKSCQEERCRW